MRAINAILLTELENHFFLKLSNWRLYSLLVTKFRFLTYLDCLPPFHKKKESNFLVFMSVLNNINFEICNPLPYLIFKIV